MTQTIGIKWNVACKTIEEDLRKRVQTFREHHGKAPALATILVGNDPASATYVKMKEMPAPGSAWIREGYISVSPLQQEN